MVVRGEVDEAEIFRATQLSGDERAIKVAVPANAWRIVHAIDRRHDLADDESQAAIGSDGSAQHSGPMLVLVAWEQVLVQVVPLGWAKPQLQAGIIAHGSSRAPLQPCAARSVSRRLRVSGEIPEELAEAPDRRAMTAA
jgi:hypothetical protein